MRKGPGGLLAIALLGAAGLGGYLLLQRNAEPPLQAPVFTALPHALSGKLAAFHADLRAAGRLRTLTPGPERWAVTPLRDTATVAVRLRPLLGLD